MNDSEPAKLKRRWHRLTPERFLIGLLAVEVFLGLGATQKQLRRIVAFRSAKVAFRLHYFRGAKGDHPLLAEVIPESSLGVDVKPKVLNPEPSLLCCGSVAPDT